MLAGANASHVKSIRSVRFARETGDLTPLRFKSRGMAPRQRPILGNRRSDSSHDCAGRLAVVLYPSRFPGQILPLTP